jgi:putative transposase
MPWHETDTMDQRCKFVISYLSGHFEMIELCRSYGISRPTGYKWVERYRAKGAVGLQDHSRAPHHCPHRMSEKSARWLLAERGAHPSWGPRKLLRRYVQAHSRSSAPSRSAIAALLRRHGLSERKRARRFANNTGRAVRVASAPNQLWTIDYKGEFLTTDHQWCYPLTLRDCASRYLLECRAHPRISGDSVHARMQWAFKEYGLPGAIHSDNGAPFAASNSLAGLSRLSVQWLKLGITLQRSRPACPQDNGAHERMHRTLKSETARPAAANLRAQQRRFDRFRHEFNNERPHEALNDDTPAQHYRPSTRAYPSRIQLPEYPGHFQVRSVRTDGSIKWLGKLLFVSTALRGEQVGLEEIEEGLWSLSFMTHLLGRIDVRTMKIIHVPV